MASFLDSAGVTRLVSKLKTIFAVKATTLSGYGIQKPLSHSHLVSDWFALQRF